MRTFDPADHLTTDAIGPPGERVFYLQVGSVGSPVTTVIVEKQQVLLLASSILEILARVDRETSDEEYPMDLLQPVDPLWRAGRLSIGYEDDRDLIVMEIDELLPEDEDGEPVGDPDQIRIFATREQMLAFARRGTEVSERGRPLCELCGNPIDPEGHACPATNGHKNSTQLR